MKVIVNIPLQATRVYEGDFEETSIPNVGEQFDDTHIVVNKTIRDKTGITYESLKRELDSIDNTVKKVERVETVELKEKNYEAL